jgi:hypothetical protein
MDFSGGLITNPYLNIPKDSKENSVHPNTTSVEYKMRAGNIA